MDGYDVAPEAGEYFSARIFKFSDNNVSVYTVDGGDDPSEKYLEESVGIQFVDGKIKLTEESENFNFGNSNTFTINGNEITIVHDEYGSSYVIKPYTASFPPASWGLRVDGEEGFEEPNDTKATAYKLSLVNIAGAISVNVDNLTLTAGDVDWFQFTVESGSAYSITAQNEYDDDLTVEAYNGDTKLELYSIFMPNTYTCPTPGTYHFKVSGGEGIYSLTVAKIL